MRAGGRVGARGVGVGVGVVREESPRDLMLDRADVPEALAADEGVAAVALVLHPDQGGLHEHAIALREVPRGDETLPVPHAAHRDVPAHAQGGGEARVVRRLRRLRGRREEGVDLRLTTRRGSRRAGRRRHRDRTRSARARRRARMCDASKTCSGGDDIALVRSDGSFLCRRPTAV